MMNPPTTDSARRCPTFAGTALFTLLAVAFAVAPAGAAGLEMRFIANAGVEISDGVTTLLIDFPYRSGAYGYLTFPDRELDSREATTCLFTHVHADHFDAAGVERVGCSVAGPTEVLREVVPERRAEGVSPWTLGDAVIDCVSTDHGTVEHCSYLIDWGGTRLFVTGDVEDFAGLNGKGKIDLLVLPAWLAPKWREASELFPGARIVVTHRAENETIEGCDDCLVPEPGDTIRP